MATLIDLFFDAWLIILGIGVIGGIVMAIVWLVTAAWDKLNK